MNSPPRSKQLQNKSPISQTPPSPGIALASRIVDGIVGVFSPNKSPNKLQFENTTGSVNNTDSIPPLQHIYKACASGKFCSYPWEPIPKAHKCTPCGKHMHTWCFGKNKAAIDFEKEWGFVYSRVPEELLLMGHFHVC